MTFNSDRSTEKNMLNNHLICYGNSSTQQESTTSIQQESTMKRKFVEHSQYFLEKTFYLNKSRTKLITICIELETWNVRIKLLSKFCSLVFNIEDWYDLLDKKSQIMLFMLNELDDVQLEIGGFQSSLTKYQNNKVLNVWDENVQIMLGEVSVFELFRISGLVNLFIEEYKNLNIKQMINNIIFMTSNITGGMLTYEAIEDTIQKVGSKYGTIKYFALNELLYYYYYEIFHL